MNSINVGDSVVAHVPAYLLPSGWHYNQECFVSGLAHGYVEVTIKRKTWFLKRQIAAWIRWDEVSPVITRRTDGTV